MPTLAELRRIWLGQPQQGRRDHGGQRLDDQDPAADGYRAEDAGDDNAGQEKCENRSTADDPVPDKRPQQARSEEAVIETLIGRQHRRRLSGFRGGPERPTTERRAPQEHLEHEEVEMQGGDQNNGYPGGQSHGR
jgi:hypothetical protein